MTHVVCVGDLMIDVLAQLPGPLAPGSDTPSPITFMGGGAAANVATWLVAAGAAATFVGTVGEDAFGRQAVAEVQAAGVATAVVVDPSRPTGVCLVLVAPDGERTMIPSAGANASRGGPLPDDADWLYLSGYALIAAGSRDSARFALTHARQRGWSVAVDVASAAPLAALGAESFLRWIGTDLLVFANAAEAVVLTGVAEPAAGATALAQQCGQAVVKCGAAGAVWSDGVETMSVPAATCPVVDSTGAGDAFAAGFLAGGPDVPDRLAAATRLAARAISRLGARPSA